MSGERTTIAIVCTDKGQHPSITLGDLIIVQGGQFDGLLRANQEHGFDIAGKRNYGPHAHGRRGECVWLDDVPVAPNTEARVHMRCPRCKRHVQWRYETAVDRLERLARLTGTNGSPTPSGAARFVQLDLSALP